MVLKREKLMWFNGKQYVDIRSYELEAHKKRKVAIRVIVKDEYMDVEPKDFKKGITIDPQIHDSKINPGQTYTLISFEWIPTGKIAPIKEIEYF